MKAQNQSLAVLLRQRGQKARQTAGIQALEQLPGAIALTRAGNAAVVMFPGGSGRAFLPAQMIPGQVQTDGVEPGEKSAGGPEPLQIFVHLEKRLLG